MDTESKITQTENNNVVIRVFKTPNMSQKKRIKASAEQLTFLCEYMNKHPELAKGVGGILGRAAGEKQWQALAKKLNSISGPHKSSTKWKQAWRGIRNNLKKKVPSNDLEAYLNYDVKGDPCLSKEMEPEVDPMNICDSSEIDNIKVIYPGEQSGGLGDQTIFYVRAAAASPEPSSFSDHALPTDWVQSPEPGLSLFEQNEESPQPELPPAPELLPDSAPPSIPASMSAEPSISPRKQRIAERLANLLKIEENKIKVEKERNRILSQKNKISTEKVAAINRLTDVLQDILTNLINK